MQNENSAVCEQSDSVIPGNIFLVGMMGAGKTSVGRVLAKRMNKVFYDSDHVIEERTGVKIPVIFEIEGETGFRHRESSVLEELTAFAEVVLATGGGAVLARENRERLRNRGTVVYLRASVKDLLNRTRHDKNRPLLQTADPRARLNELYEMRDPLYREVAHVTIDTGSQSLTTLVNRLHQVLESRRDRPAMTDHPQCEP
ncbi:MAG: shikimate kinase AroK [Prolixibacteraceae bacterium]|nr:shikimate kinase AroK [Burkholderiales bacterium]